MKTESTKACKVPENVVLTWKECNTDIFSMPVAMVLNNEQRVIQSARI